MVAYLSKLLPLLHPPQHYLHVPLARQSSQTNFLIKWFRRLIKQFVDTIHIRDGVDSSRFKNVIELKTATALLNGSQITLTWSQVSEMVRGPCSLTISKMALVMVCVCSGGVLSSIGFIFGLGFLPINLIAVPNMLMPFVSLNYSQFAIEIPTAWKGEWATKKYISLVKGAKPES